MPQLRGENAVGVGYTETSLDQAYTPVIALHTYVEACDLATPAERTEVQQRVRAPARPGSDRVASV